uniref:HMA domain-containing protein n=1 Tax=Oryza meridionalis TaxID=40149 RepID=A0A0E0DF47_9ORYZ
MKQKMVIKVTMPCGKCRSKAMALVAGASGVSSVEVTGDGKDRLQVVGDGVDPVCVVNRLRKKIGHAEIVQVEEVKDKKPDPPKKPEPPKPPVRRGFPGPHEPEKIHRASLLLSGQEVRFADVLQVEEVKDKKPEEEKKPAEEKKPEEEKKPPECPCQATLPVPWCPPPPCYYPPPPSMVYCDEQPSPCSIIVAARNALSSPSHASGLVVTMAMRRYINELPGVAFSSTAKLSYNRK